MPRKKGQPKKLPILTVKELQEINVQQEVTKPAISKAALARYFFLKKLSFTHFYAVWIIPSISFTHFYAVQIV